MNAGLKLLPVAVALFAATLGTQHAAAEGKDGAEGVPTPTALFEFTDGYDVFVFGLSDPAKIQLVRKALADPSKPAVHISGHIAKREVAYNSQWGFYLVPDSVVLIDAAIPVCDASIHAVQQNLTYVGGAFLPGRWWCPSRAWLTRELHVGVGDLATNVHGQQ